MSPPKRSLIGGHWLLWLQPDGLQLLTRTRGERGAFALTDTVRVPRADILLAVTGMLGQLRKGWPWEVTIAVPSSWAPGFTIDLPAPKAPESVLTASVQMRREQLFGVDERQWRVAYDRQWRSGRTVAFALPAETIAQWRSAAGRWASLRILPSSVWGMRRVIDFLESDAWYLHDEGDRAVALRVYQGRLDGLALLPPFNGGLDACSKALHPWDRRIGDAPIRKVLYGTSRYSDFKDQSAVGLLDLFSANSLRSTMFGSLRESAA